MRRVSCWLDKIASKRQTLLNVTFQYESEAPCILCCSARKEEVYVARLCAIKTTLLEWSGFYAVTAKLAVIFALNLLCKTSKTSQTVNIEV